MMSHTHPALGKLLMLRDFPSSRQHCWAMPCSVWALAASRALNTTLWATSQQVVLSLIPAVSGVRLYQNFSNCGPIIKMIWSVCSDADFLASGDVLQSGVEDLIFLAPHSRPSSPLTLIPQKESHHMWESKLTEDNHISIRYIYWYITSYVLIVSLGFSLEGSFRDAWIHRQFKKYNLKSITQPAHSAFIDRKTFIA